MIKRLLTYYRVICKVTFFWALLLTCKHCYRQNNENLWNSRLNAQGLKIFIIAVYPTTNDWLKAIQKKKRQDEIQISTQCILFQNCFFQKSHALYDQPGVLVLCFLYFDANFISTDYWMWKPTKDFTFGLSESEHWITYQLLLMQLWKGKMVAHKLAEILSLMEEGGTLTGEENKPHRPPNFAGFTSCEPPAIGWPGHYIS
jgi:hypothetical protein